MLTDCCFLIKNFPTGYLKTWQKTNRKMVFRKKLVEYFNKILRREPKNANSGLEARVDIVPVAAGKSVNDDSIASRTAFENLPPYKGISPQTDCWNYMKAVLGDLNKDISETAKEFDKMKESSTRLDNSIKRLKAVNEELHKVRESQAKVQQDLYKFKESAEKFKEANPYSQKKSKKDQDMEKLLRNTKYDC